jgi:hypothetical protein
MHRTNGGNGKSGDLVGDMIKGAIAGAVATWVMDRVTWEMYLTEDAKAFEQEKEAQFEGKYGAHVAADKVERKTGMDLSHDQHYRLAKSIHYSWGAMPGAMYGALRHRMGPLGQSGGLAYGLGLFLVMDELMGPFVAGVTNKPQAYPWQAHARGLVGHLVLGAITDSVLDTLDLVA